jgi:hypothetical protein
VKVTRKGVDLITYSGVGDNGDPVPKYVFPLLLLFEAIAGLKRAILLTTFSMGDAISIALLVERLTVGKGPGSGGEGRGSREIILRKQENWGAGEAVGQSMRR